MRTRLMIHGDHVRDHTREDVLDGIDADIEARVDDLARSPRFIEQRLRELEGEWDVERWLGVNASALALTGTLLGLRRRRWMVLPAIVLPFLAQHAVQGWCPPLGLFRRLGVRTRQEIETERVALKAIRGDFSYVDSVDGADRAPAALAAATV